MLTCPTTEETAAALTTLNQHLAGARFGIGSPLDLSWSIDPESGGNSAALNEALLLLKRGVEYETAQQDVTRCDGLAHEAIRKANVARDRMGLGPLVVAGP